MNHAEEDHLERPTSDGSRDDPCGGIPDWLEAEILHELEEMLARSRPPRSSLEAKVSAANRPGGRRP
jgi:hypothetical protein